MKGAQFQSVVLNSSSVFGQVLHLVEASIGSEFASVPGMVLNLINSQAIIGVNFEESTNEIFACIRDLLPRRGRKFELANLD